jgi:hypothetical protein
MEMEHKYQQQLDIDRQRVIAQIDAVYTHKLQQVLARFKIAAPPDLMSPAATTGTGSQLQPPGENGFH